METIIIPYY